MITKGKVSSLIGIYKLKNTLSKDALFDKLLKGSFVSFFVKSMGALLTFLVQILITRLIGAEGYGNYIYVLTWVNLLVLVGKLGYDNATLKFIPVYYNKGEAASLKGFINHSNKMVTGLSLLISVIFLSITIGLHARLNQDLYYSLCIGAFLIPFSSFVFLYSSRLRAYKKIFLALSPQEMWRPLLLIILIYITSKVTKLSAYSVVLLYTLTVILSFIYLWYSQRRPAAKGLKAEKIKKNTKAEWLQVSVSFFIISGFNMLISKTDILFVGYFLSIKEAGIYAVATRIGSIMVFALGVVNLIVAPMISELYASHKMKELQRLVNQALQVIVFSSIPIMLVIVLFGHLILGLFGSEFKAGYMALIIISFGQLVNAFSGPVGFLMNMTGHHKMFLKVLGLSTLMNIIVIYFLIQWLGVEGAALSTSFTIIVWNITLVLLVRKHVGIKLHLFKRMQEGKE